MYTFLKEINIGETNQRSVKENSISKSQICYDGHTFYYQKTCI